MLDRETDPLKQWKLSRIDVDGLRNGTTTRPPSARRCDRSHTAAAPWTVIRSDDKPRARLAAIQRRPARHGLQGPGKAIIGTLTPDLRRPGHLDV
jgi:polyphosphate kinase